MDKDLDLVGALKSIGSKLTEIAAVPPLFTLDLELETMVAQLGVVLILLATTEKQNST